MTRRHLDLDGPWAFVPDPDASLTADTLPPGDDIEVPACWESHVGPDVPLTTAWYRRSFRLPDDWAAPRAVLRFDAVSDHADVWLNGLHLGEHDGGATRFELDATGALRAGSNELVVRAHNPAGAIAEYPVLGLPSIDAVERGHPGATGLSELPIGKQTWYSSLSGIWRSVTLAGLPDGGLRSVHVTPDGVSGGVVVDWLRDDHGTDASAGWVLRLAVIDATGTEVAVSMLPDPAARGQMRLVVDEPRLWDLDDPYRYRVRAELLMDQVPIDAMDVPFGIRSIGTIDGRVALNGRPLFVRGALDQDVFPETLWLPGSRAALVDQLRAAKAMGLNLLRCHIKVPDPAYLEIADEIGLLVWAEIPSWGRLTASSQRRVTATLHEMVDQLRDHPSVVIWTIVNEDWGTDLARDAGHRRWLRTMSRDLKALDPTRLVVDNSPCWRPDGGTFHVSTDIADFHVYFGIPDHDDRWRAVIDDFRTRPTWLWSPHGDATMTGTEPLILSEFGGWGLPLPEAVPTLDEPATDGADTRADRLPWWALSGEGTTRPAGVWRRFADLGLDRIADSPTELAAATQWHQFQALQRSVAELRRHPDIAGYVMTELTDAFWEANGLVHLDRSDKVFGDRLVDVLGPDTLFADLERWDHWAGTTLVGDLQARSDGGRLTRPVARWLIDGPGVESRSGTIELDVDDTGGIATGRLEVVVPPVDRSATARLALVLVDELRGMVCRQTYPLAVLPGHTRRTASPRRLALSGTLEGGALAARIRDLGHAVEDRAPLLIGDRLDDHALGATRDGGSLLIVLDAADEGMPWVSRPASTDGLVTARDRARPLEVHSRHGAREPGTHRQLGLDGDWVALFSWADRAAFPGLPPGALFDLAYRDVVPRLAILGADQHAYATEVVAGAFAGWIADPVAWAWRFRQRAGQVTVTTLRLAGGGPVATVMLDALIAGATPA